MQIAIHDISGMGKLQRLQQRPHEASKFWEVVGIGNLCVLQEGLHLDADVVLTIQPPRVIRRASQILGESVEVPIGERIRHRFDC